MGPPPLANADRISVTVLDRHGQLLRAFTTPDGRWRLPVEPEDVDQRYLTMLLAFEDQRFRSHHGVDMLALGRAALQLVANGRIISGASTITMQVARLLEGEHDRSLAGKFRQMIRALQLEASLSKDEILRLYLRLAPFGGNLEGVRAASLAYFGKEPRRLSVGEAALLVALPQSPEVRRPDRSPEAARRARGRVLARLVAAGTISAADAGRASHETVPTARVEFPKLAPHLAESEVAREAHLDIHRLTLDRDLQASLETLARSHARGLGDRLSAAILAIDHRTGEVLAHVGSSDYLDPTRLGAIDMTEAVRSPGSTLKPVIYGLAFEAGFAHPETLIEDRPARFGSYAPKNFDEDFHGTVSVRQALQQSLNIPAVKLLNVVGPSALVGRFRRVGLPPALAGDAEPTLAIALGGVGFTLSDLAGIYVALARGGEVVPIVHRQGSGSAARAAAFTTEPLLSAVAAWYVTDILKDSPPPASAFTRPYRLQDRHLLRLPRRLGDRLRWALYDRSVGRACRRGVDPGAHRAHRRRAAAFRCVPAGLADAHSAAASARGRDRDNRGELAAAAQAVRWGRRRPGQWALSRSTGRDRLPARPVGGRGRGRRDAAGTEGRGRCAAAHLDG